MAFCFQRVMYRARFFFRLVLSALSLVSWAWGVPQVSKLTKKILAIMFQPFTLLAVPPPFANDPKGVGLDSTVCSLAITCS